MSTRYIYMFICLLTRQLTSRSLAPSRETIWKNYVVTIFLNGCHFNSLSRWEATAPICSFLWKQKYLNLCSEVKKWELASILCILDGYFFFKKKYAFIWLICYLSSIHPLKLFDFVAIFMLTHQTGSVECGQNFVGPMKFSEVKQFQKSWLLLLLRL